MTRPPVRSLHEHDSDELEELEELGDDAIIAQQSEAHVPRPRAKITEEPRSVVISDHPSQPDSISPRASSPRSRGEATVVIRDRRALDQVRSHFASQGQRARKAKSRRGLYFWGGLGLVAFLFGGVVAFFSATPESNLAEPRAVRSHADHGPAPSTSIAPLSPKDHAESDAPGTQAPRAVRLDQLPVERTFSR